MLFSVYKNCESWYPENLSKILKAEISLSVLNLMYLSEYITDSSKLDLKI